MRIAIATDAWAPQTNGVVTTLRKTAETLETWGHEVLFVTPEPFRSVPLPTYRSIRLALWPKRGVRRMLDQFAPDCVHIATEGPIGLAARNYCLSRGLRFTTSYHTQFPEYIRLRAPVPLEVSYTYMRWFHRPATRTLVPTESQRKLLQERGFRNVKIWTRGVDTELFRPYTKDFLDDPRPVFAYVGRVAVEKNIEAFLNLDLPGSKYVIGDGPDLARLHSRHPEVHFTGFKFGEELARHIAGADVFVFPSRTDTFGLVLLEAMACGVPVAAYPVTGPVDVVLPGITGMLDEDLGKAALEALALDPHQARAYALTRSWDASTRQFFDHLAVNEAPQVAMG